MKAIFTKYHGPTNTRGSRISARDSDGNRTSISYPYELSGEDCHRKAADALCAKMGWTGDMVAGGTQTGYVFVFTNEGKHYTAVCPVCMKPSLHGELCDACENEGNKVKVLVRPKKT